jgi:hypothetical protein
MGHHRVHTKPKHFLAVMMVHCARHCLNIYVPNIGVITCSDNFAAKNTEIRTPIWQKGATNERFSIFTNLSLYGERKSAANTFDAWHLAIRHVEVSLLNLEYGDKRVKRRGKKKKKPNLTVAVHCRFAKSHNRTVVSSEPDNRSVPERLNAMTLTHPFQKTGNKRQNGVCRKK